MYISKMFPADQTAIASRLAPTVRSRCIRETLIGCEAAFASKLGSHREMRELKGQVTQRQGQKIAASFHSTAPTVHLGGQSKSSWV